MTDLSACQTHMQTLGLNFPFTAEQEQQRFEDLVKAHHPDFCDDDVCRETNKPLMEKIAEAHLYLHEHGEKCHVIERENSIKHAKDFYQEHHGVDISGFSTSEMDHIDPLPKIIPLALAISINDSGKVEVASSGRILIVDMSVDPQAGNFIHYDGLPGFNYDSVTGKLRVFGPIDDINRMFELLRFTLADSSFASSSVSIWVDDGKNSAAQINVPISQFNLNNSPVVDQGLPAVIKLKATKNFVYEIPTDVFKDVDKDILNYRLNWLDDGQEKDVREIIWLNYDSIVRKLYGIPEETDIGQLYPLRYKVSDGYGGDNSIAFQLEVINANPEKGEGIPDQVVPLGKAYEYTIPKDVFTDVAGANMLYRVYWMQDDTEGPLPSWLTFDGVKLYGTPDPAELNNEYQIKVLGNDGTNEVYAIFSLLISHQRPVLQGDIPDQIAAAKFPYEYQFDETLFQSRETLTYSARWLDGESFRLLIPPFWLSFDPSIRMFSGEARIEDINTVFSMQVIASDGYSQSSIQFNIRIRENFSPVLEIPIEQQTAYTGEAFSLMIPADTFRDPDDDVITYEAVEKGEGVLTAWLQIEGSKGIFSGQPKESDKGTATIQLTALDGFGGNATTMFDVKVNYPTSWYVKLALKIGGPTLAVITKLALLYGLRGRLWNLFFKSRYVTALQTMKLGETLNYTPTHKKSGNKIDPSKIKKVRMLVNDENKHLRRAGMSVGRELPDWANYDRRSNVLSLAPRNLCDVGVWTVQVFGSAGGLLQQYDFNVTGPGQDVEMQLLDPLMVEWGGFGGNGTDITQQRGYDG